EGLEDEPEGSMISEVRRTAEIAFQFYENKHKAKATEALTVLLMQLQSVFGSSEAFFQVFSVLKKVKAAIEQEDFEGGKAPLLAILAKLRGVEANMQAEDAPKRAGKPAKKRPPKRKHAPNVEAKVKAEDSPKRRGAAGKPAKKQPPKRKLAPKRLLY